MAVLAGGGSSERLFEDGEGKKGLAVSFRFFEPSPRTSMKFDSALKAENPPPSSD